MERTAVILAVCAIVAHLQLSVQQGLVSDPKAVLRASRSYDTFKIIYGQAQDLKRAFQQGAASSACSKSPGSICSPNADIPGREATVLMATSPQSFDARSTGALGSFSAVAQPKDIVPVVDLPADQGQCNSSVAFAVLAAAQSAMACALRQDISSSSSSSISEQDFFFCKSVSPGKKRSCGSSWSMIDGIQALVSLQNAKNYLVTEHCLPWNPGDSSPCHYRCQDVQQQLKQGTFTYKKLENVWEMQEHIRNWGSVVTRLEVYSDFKPFFARNASGIYPGHGPSASKVFSHAIQVVGYDLKSQPQSWLCKTSWGTGFAAGGFFRIALGTDGVGSPNDTYGIKYVTPNPPSKPYNRLSKGAGGCHYYWALPNDFVSRVAHVFNISPSQILMDNKDILKQPDMLLTNMTLLLCGMSVPQQLQGSSGWYGGSSTQSQPVGVKPHPKQSRPRNPQAEQVIRCGCPATLSETTSQTHMSAAAVDTNIKLATGLTFRALLVMQTQPQPQPQTPLFTTNVRAGIYKGKIACGGAAVDATFTVSPGTTDGTFALEVSPYLTQFISCDYQMHATCTRSKRGLCKADQEPWGCRYHGFLRTWDSCPGLPDPRFDPDPRHLMNIEMCFSMTQASGATFTMAEQNPMCKKFTGVVQLVGGRRLSVM